MFLILFYIYRLIHKWIGIWILVSLRARLVARIWWLYYIYKQTILYFFQWESQLILPLFWLLWLLMVKSMACTHFWPSWGAWRITNRCQVGSGTHLYVVVSGGVQSLHDSLNIWIFFLISEDSVYCRLLLKDS